MLLTFHQSSDSGSKGGEFGQQKRVEGQISTELAVARLTWKLSIPQVETNHLVTPDLFATC